MSDTPRSDPAEPPLRALQPGPSHRLHRLGWLPDVDTARCTGCGWCVAACDLHLLSLEVAHGRKASVLHAPERCTGCSDCAVTCPFHVITMRKARAA
jgi:ferredoxin